MDEIDIAEVRRRKRPGVIGVGFGLKEMDGQVMRDSLRGHGSEDLQIALDAYAGKIIARAESFDDLHDPADRFEREAAPSQAEEAYCGAS